MESKQVTSAAGALSIADFVPGLRRAGAREMCGPCLWCGGRDRMRVWPDEGRCGRYYCRRCGARGDAINLLREQGQSFTEACRTLGLDPGDLARLPAPAVFRPSAPPEIEPSDAWRTAAREATLEAMRRLWGPGGAVARSFLRGRGLHGETMRKAFLGYSPGLRHGGLQVPGPAVTMPWPIGGALWEVKARMLKADASPRYMTVTWFDAGRRKGDAAGQPHLFNGDAFRSKEIGVLVEGELDALLLHQEAGDLVAVGTFGSASSALTARAARLLLPMKRVILALDADEVGREAAQRLMSRYPGLALERAEVPRGKDIGEFHAQGGSLYDWVRAIIRRSPESTP